MASPPLLSCLPQRWQSQRQEGEQRSLGGEISDNSALGCTQDGSFLVVKAKGKEAGKADGRVKRWLVAIPQALTAVIKALFFKNDERSSHTAGCECPLHFPSFASVWANQLSTGHRPGLCWVLGTERSEVTYSPFPQMRKNYLSIKHWKSLHPDCVELEAAHSCHPDTGEAQAGGLPPV